MKGSVFLRTWPPIVNTYFFRYNVLEPLSPASELERFSPKIPVILYIACEFCSTAPAGLRKKKVLRPCYTRLDR